MERLGDAHKVTKEEMAHGAPNSSQRYSPIVIISRIVMMVFLFAFIYLGYRLWIVRAVDHVFGCVEEVIVSVDSIDALVDGSEGLLETDAEVVRETAARAYLDLEKTSGCLSRNTRGSSGELIETCGLVSEKAKVYALRVEEVAARASLGEDTYESQKSLADAYSAYRASVFTCEEKIEAELSRVR